MAATVSGLFDKTVSVCWKFSEKEERDENIRIVVELRTVTAPLHKKELCVSLRNDQDPFFLYNLTVGEDDFQNLKSQQGLLVDFSAFPQKFIDLLELCIQEKNKDSPRFLLQLVTGQLGGSELYVVETNPFKHLTHLSLKLTPANDNDIKHYLADCLRHLKEERGRLQDQLQRSEAELTLRLRHTQEALSARSQELDTLKAEWVSATNSLTAKHAQQINQQKQSMLEVQNQSQQAYEKQLRETEARQQLKLQELEARLKEAEGANLALTQKSYGQEAARRELEERLGRVTEERERLAQLHREVRADKGRLESAGQAQEQACNQLRLRLAVLEQEVEDNRQVASKTSDLLQATQQQKAQLEESVKEKQAAVGKLEKALKSTSDEVIKGNEIIKKLQGELKTSLAKIKLKNTVTTQQEKLLAEKEGEVEQQRGRLGALEASLQAAQQENGQLSLSLQATAHKLEESRQLLKTNENVISWLNKQVTETQLAQQPAPPKPADPGMTHRFRPSQHPHQRQVEYGGVGAQPGPPPVAHSTPTAVAMATRPTAIPVATTRPGPGPAIDAKYFEKREGKVAATAAPTAQGVRGDLITVTSNQPQPPLLSAYFPGSQSATATKTIPAS